jgi:hypothetical protein
VYLVLRRTCFLRRGFVRYMLYLLEVTIECLVVATNSMCREGEARPGIIGDYRYVKRIVSRLNIKLCYSGTMLLQIK